jgi:hypothetical protein
VDRRRAVDRLINHHRIDTIGTDRVDAEWIVRSHRWNAGFIRSVMFAFGMLSSVAL